MARRLAQDKIRKHDKTEEVRELEKSLTETLGTRVFIENRPNGGRVLIEFFSPEDLSHIAAILAERKELETAVLNPNTSIPAEPTEEVVAPQYPNTTLIPEPQIEPVSEETKEDDLYSISNFVV